jgi:hypothetical protein
MKSFNYVELIRLLMQLEALLDELDIEYLAIKRK